MEFDPFAPESLGKAIQIAETKPSLWETIRGEIGNFANRAGALLWFAGSMVAFDQASAQEVAVVTPQWKPIAGLVVPGNPETITEEVPTAEAVVAILRNGKEKIRIKFPTYNDAAFQQIVGQISLGTVKPETLAALAWAFEKGSEEEKAILGFSKKVSTTPPKPAPLASAPDARAKKLPPLNETKEERERRIAEKKKEKDRDLLLWSFNTSVKKEGTWWRAANWNQDVSIKEKGGHISIQLKITDKNAPNPNGIAATRTQIAPWEYELQLDSTAGAILWLTNAGGKCIDMQGNISTVGKERILIAPGQTSIIVPEGTTNFTLWFQVTPLNPEVIIKKVELRKK